MLQQVHLFHSHAVIKRPCATTSGGSNLVLDVLAQMRPLDHDDSKTHAYRALLIVGQPRTGRQMSKAVDNLLRMSLPECETFAVKLFASQTVHLGLLLNVAAPLLIANRVTVLPIPDKS